LDNIHDIRKSNTITCSALMLNEVARWTVCKTLFSICFPVNLHISCC